MPYCTNYSTPKKDDVVWSNDGMLPENRQFVENDDMPCTWKDDDNHKTFAAGYRFDPEVGWCLACYECCMEALDSDSILDKAHPYNPTKLPEKPAEKLGGRELAEELKKERKVPLGALCDNPHPEADDAPLAVVGVFGTRKKSQMKDRFLCGTCTILFIHESVVGKMGDFEPFEMMPVGKKGT